MVANCIHNRFQQKDYIETLQTMEILYLKASREEDFGHEFQQMSSLFSSDLDKFKLGTQPKTLTHNVGEKQVRIKDAIKIISSLNASQNLQLSHVLKLVKLMLTVLATNAISERSRSPLYRVKTSYLRSSMTQERLSSCLILLLIKRK